MNDIDKLIQRYFDAETTLTEERELRQWLASHEPTTPLQREAKATMSYLTADAKAKREKRGNRRTLPSWTRIAASLAVIVGVAVALSLTVNSRGAVAECYIAGVDVTSSSDVHSIMLSQLSIVAQSDNEMNDNIAEEFNEISEAFNDIEL